MIPYFIRWSRKANCYWNALYSFCRWCHWECTLLRVCSPKISPNCFRGLKTVVEIRLEEYQIQLWNSAVLSRPIAIILLDSRIAMRWQEFDSGRGNKWFAHEKWQTNVGDHKRGVRRRSCDRSRSWSGKLFWILTWLLSEERRSSKGWSTKLLAEGTMILEDFDLESIL